MGPFTNDVLLFTSFKLRMLLRGVVVFISVSDRSTQPNPNPTQPDPQKPTPPHPNQTKPNPTSVSLLLLFCSLPSTCACNMKERLHPVAHDVLETARHIVEKFHSSKSVRRKTVCDAEHCLLFPIDEQNETCIRCKNLSIKDIEEKIEM